MEPGLRIAMPLGNHLITQGAPIVIGWVRPTLTIRLITEKNAHHQQSLKQEGASQNDEVLHIRVNRVVTGLEQNNLTESDCWLYRSEAV
jgi:hypothetical protein